MKQFKKEVKQVLNHDFAIWEFWLIDMSVGLELNRWKVRTKHFIGMLTAASYLIIFLWN